MMIERTMKAPEDTFNTHGVSLQKRMGTYKNNYTTGLGEVLAGTFQTVTALVGEEFMQGVCAQFTRKHSPKKACMHEYGNEFPEFLEQFEPAKSLPYLPDMARLDWCANTAYHAHNIPALTPEALQSIDLTADGLTLKIHPSATTLHSDFAINDLRAYVRDEERQKNEKFQITQSDTSLLISRQNGMVYIQDLTPAEYTILNTHEPLMETIGTVMEKFPEFDFQTFLQKTISCETFLVPPTNSPIET